MRPMILNQLANTPKNGRHSSRGFLKHLRSYKRASVVFGAFVLVGVLTGGFMIVSGRAAGLGIHLPASVTKIFASKTAARTAPAPRTISAPAPMPLTGGGSITGFGSALTENFDTLAQAGTNIAWTDNTTLSGGYSSRTTYNAGTGSSNTGALYSFGVAGTNPVTDRALGGVGSGGTGTFYYGFKLTNNTGSSIRALSIAYTGEQWRDGGAAVPVAQTGAFQYQVANAGTITDVDVPATGWTTFSSLSFTSPTFTNTGAGVALDGNAAANRTAKSATLTLPTPATSGQEIWIRWEDLNDAGNDHGLAIDDLSITALQPTITVVGGPLNFADTAVGATSAEQTYTVSGSNLTNDITVTAPSTDFQVSTTTGTGFGPSVTFTQTGGTVATQTVFVHFTPQSTGLKSGNVANTSTDAITQNVAAQSATPEVILGIWENGHAHASNITISGNTFTNQGAGNNTASNLQRSFRVTSHSSATTTVAYQNNTVTGANIGFQWIAGSAFAANQPVVVKSNTITGNGTGVLVQSQGLANLSFNRIVGNTSNALVRWSCTRTPSARDSKKLAADLRG